MTVKLNFVMDQQREQLPPAPVREQLQADMEDRVNKDIVQYNILWSGDSEWVMDEVVNEEEAMTTSMETDGWPREGCLHRWVNVIEAKGWDKEEKKHLRDVIEAYCDFSTRSGAYARGEIYVRHGDWHGALMDTRENAHEDPKVVVMGWEKKEGRVMGELWEKEHQYEETILTRRTKEIAKIRWTSPLLLPKEEPVTPDESNIGEIEKRSNMEEDDATHNLKVDSSKRILKERTEADNMIENTQEDQSQGEVRGVTTPHVLLPLQELCRLRDTIRKILRE